MENQILNNSLHHLSITVLSHVSWFQNILYTLLMYFVQETDLLLHGCTHVFFFFFLFQYFYKAQVPDDCHIKSKHVV